MIPILMLLDYSPLMMIGFNFRKFHFHLWAQEIQRQMMSLYIHQRHLVKHFQTQLHCHRHPPQYLQPEFLVALVAQ